MSEQSAKQGLFSLPVPYVVEQLEKIDGQLIGGQDLLQHFFDSESQNHKLLIPLVVDILWSNFSALKLLTPYIDDPVFYDNPDTGEKEYMIDEPALLNLQTLLISRYYANKELNQLSYSVGLH